MKSFTWTSLFLVLAGGCGQPGRESDPPPPLPVMEEGAPIVGGTTDTGDPSVVALYGQPPGAQSKGGFLCTGTVIAPTVVLTAAHCVSPLEVEAGTQFVVVSGPEVFRRGAPQLAVRSVKANPRWNPRKLESGHDQGIVILSQPTSLRALPFIRQSLANSLLGRPLRIVGYGLNDGDAQTGAGTKRQALTTLRSISMNLIRVGDSRRGTCNGDSGGPAFMSIAGVETLVGTTSYGNEDCSDGGYDARVDTDLEFIEPFLAPSCTPTCGSRACGADGCGGLCGACGDGQSCSSAGQCLAPQGGCDQGEGGREQEPNDSALQANAVCADGAGRGSLSSTEDQDWFSWTVKGASTYTVSVTADSSDVALRVYKIGDTGRLSFIGEGPNLARHTDTGGNYVGRITAGSSLAPYALTVRSTP